MVNIKEIISKPIIKKIKSIAKKKNYKVYLVGGYVRDRLLGIDSNDIDFMIVGDAIKFAEEVSKELNVKLLAVYKNFCTALIHYEDFKLEFASARKESYDRKSRKPKVEYADLEADLSRRDFTINALAISLIKPDKIIDKFNGLKDLDNKIIRTPLDPEKTFDDDPLRILRAIRFASQLNFSIEPITLSAINKYAKRLEEDSVVSQERITNEFLLILQTPKPSIGLNLLYLTGVMDIIFPEISALVGIEQMSEYHHKDVFDHTLQVVDNVAKVSDNLWLRFAALVHDIAKPQTKKFISGIGWTFHGHSEQGARMMKNIFTRMRLPMNKLEYVKKLISLHLRPISLSEENVTDSAFRRLATEAGEYLQDLFVLCRADITSKNPDKVKKYLDNFDKVEKRIFEVQEKDNLRNFQSPVRGDEIMQICNLPPCKKVGLLKKKIEEAILDGVIPNDYNAAKEYLMKIKDDILSQEE
ncbi:MAG: CCA tRNA nucleotidyltransferase [Ignavibacteria bacterium]|nr:CCA tRNA nucleotidyltransferase [Ignavibacteria bacterium]